VRPFPAGSACAAGGPLVGKCGAGLLDARLALNAVVPTANAGVDQVVAPGALVTLNGSNSTPAGNSTITSYEWTQTAGTPTVTLSAPTQVSTTFTAPATGNLTFRLRVTDNLGKQGDDLVSVRVNSPPSLSAAPAAQSATQGQVITFSVSGSDPDNDSVTYVATSGSTVPLSALAPNGVFTWSTSGVAPGTYTLVYFATDGVAQSATQSVSITVGGGAPAPTSGGGGGLPLSQLLLLAALAFAAQIHRRK
jgi:hypothetical protein